MIRQPPRSTLFPYRRSSDLFQKKCLGKMGEVAKQGRTVLFVSHNLTAVKRLCRRTLRLDKGVIVDSGDRKSTRLNSSHVENSYAVFCLKKKTLTDDLFG